MRAWSGYDAWMDPNSLAQITARTLQHYGERADAFWAGTHDHDVSQNIDALLEHIEGDPPYRILDFGCGPGRDLKTLTERGHVAVGLDGAARFCEMARAYSGCEVLHQDFLALHLPAGRFDGIFANASLFHVPHAELPRVLGELRAALKPRGILFSSNPRGADEEGWNQGRYGTYHRPESWLRHLREAGFEVVHSYYRPSGLPLAQQPWFATVARAPTGD
ncbi:MAG TPA: class I SAM-dependent methyltransferase [Burkholderiales bacterium]|nr:class I SAM-dependent methyltransferase [Burkholderiales bacterium]